MLDQPDQPSTIDSASELATPATYISGHPDPIHPHLHLALLAAIAVAVVVILLLLIVHR